MIFTSNRFTFFITPVVSFFGWFQANAKPEVAIPKSIEPFFENYCFDCHDTDTAKAGLDLEGLTRSIVDVADAQNWQDILDQLNSGEMPPKKKAQPGKEELAKVVGDLTESLQSAQAMLKDSGGQIALRRINRREYQSTIKALLGIRIVAERLPDDSSGRFDTIGQDQTLSSMDLENYFEQGQEVVRTAMHWALKPRAKSKVVRKDYANSGKMEREIHEILEKVQEVHDTDKFYKDVGLTEYEWNRYNRGSEKYPRHANYVDRRNLAAYYVENLKYHPIGRMLPIRNLVNSMGISFLPDARAYYRSRASAGVVDGVKIRRSIRMTIAHKGKGAENGKPVGSFYVNGSIKEPSIHEVVWYPEFEDDFRPTSSKSARKSLWFGEDQRGRPPNNQLYQHYRPIEPDVPDETILVRWLEVEGPFYDQKTPFEKMVDAYKDASTRLSPEKLDTSAKGFLRMFAASAFRGQEVSDEFVSKLNTYYRAERKAGKNFLQAMVDPLAIILSSPRFLYLVNPSTNDPQNNQALDGLSLANRLSSFLWSGPPDQELLELARNGSLLKKSVLLEQTERLLSNARAENFHQGFISQWMHLDRLDGVGINTRFHLHFTDAYVHSAKREPVEFSRLCSRKTSPQII